MSNPEVSMKSILSNKRVTFKNHWKTNQDLVCQSGWEPKVVERWNTEKRNYEWQITFNIPDSEPVIGGKTYRVDAYLPDEDKYIEIKGSWRGKLFDGIPVSKLKWEWFHKTYPNSELWDQNKLKSLNII